MSVRILEGDALQVLQTLPDCSVQCCVTSPPYFGLRDYGTGSWEGGDVSCNHARKTGTTRGGPNSTLSGGQDIAPHATQFSGDCGKCGATRTDRQMGLEKTPELYVEAMVGVFREVRRVLRDDATLWLNIGDSYAGGGGGEQGRSGAMVGRAVTTARVRATPRVAGGGLKPKDLIGIPWLLAFALRADGWYLRSDIIWHKPNPMPESVTDQPTRAHEYLFLLSKSPTYYYDADAISEPSVIGIGARRNLISNPDRNDGGRKGNSQRRLAQSPLGLVSNNIPVLRSSLRNLPSQADRALHPSRISKTGV